MQMRAHKTHASEQKPKNIVNVAFWACGHIFRECRNVAQNHPKDCKNRVFGWEAVSKDASRMEHKNTHLVQQKPTIMVNVAFWACGDISTEARNMIEHRA